MRCDVRRGDVIYVSLDPTVGDETGKTRPAVVIQNDIGNQFSTTTIVAVITEYSTKKASYPVCVAVDAGEGGLCKRSIVNLSQIRSIAEERLRPPVLGRLSPKTMEKVNDSLRVSLSL